MKVSRESSAGKKGSAEKSTRSPLPATSVAPLVADAAPRGSSAGRGNENVPHGQRHVVLVVEPPSDPRDRSARYQLLDEDDPAAPTVGGLSPDVEAEIHFVEVAMKWNGGTEDPCVEEAEADHAEKRMPVPGVELRAGRNQRGYGGGIGLEVQHRQVLPGRGQEAGRGRHAFRLSTDDASADDEQVTLDAVELRDPGQ
jgi:hypothetical protein